MQYHHYCHPDGGIDYGLYRANAAALRSQAIKEIGHALRRRGKTAAVSIMTRCGRAFGAMLDRMFPEETPRPWAR